MCSNPQRSVCFAAGVLLLVAFVCGCGGSKKEPSSLHVADQAGITHYQVGHRFLKSGRPDLAAEEFKKSIAIQPDNALYHNVLGLAYIGVDNWEGAHDCFLRVLEINPYFTDAHNNLGIIYSETGRYQLALLEFRAVLQDRTYPTPEVAHYNIGRILVEQGDLEGGLSFMRRAVLKRDDRIPWRIGLGMALEKAEQYEEARDQFKEVLVQDGLNMEALYHLGVVYFALKEYELARPNFQRVFSLSPRSGFGQRSQEYLKKLK